MTSYGGPSLGPESPAHGNQRVYLGQMVKGLMVQPWSLGQPENIWHGMLTAVHTCAASYISPQAASKVFIQRGSPDSLGCRLINSGALADPELQRRGGQILAEIFERPFFRRFPKKF